MQSRQTTMELMEAEEGVDDSHFVTLIEQMRDTIPVKRPILQNYFEPTFTLSCKVNNVCVMIESCDSKRPTVQAKSYMFA
jgi:hypothetical protein